MVEPSSRPARSLGPWFPTLASPHGVTCRFRVFLRKCSSEGIGFFAPGLRFPLVLSPKLRASRCSHTLHTVRRDPNDVPSCGFGPLQGLLPKVLPGTSRCQAPLLGLSCRSAHSFRGSPLPSEIPAPSTFRVQGFSPSARLAPPTASRVYFTPQTPFGFTLQGVPLPGSSGSSSLPRCRRAVSPRLRSHLLEWRDQRRTHRHS